MIVDCIMASYETDALAVRSVELDGVVDARVIVQGEETFRGQPLEPLDPDITRWCSTPTIIARIGFGDVTDPWEREVALREFSLSRGRGLGGGRALLILADADEIPHPEAIRAAAAGSGPALLPVDYREWWMDWRAPDGWQPPHQPLIGRWNHYVVAGGAQAARAAYSWPSVGPRGWHLSTLGDGAMASVKLSAFAHSEYDTPDHNDAGILEQRREAGRDILDRFALALALDVPGCADQFPHLLAPAHA